MTPQPELLLPEIDASSIVDDTEHLGYVFLRLFVPFLARSKSNAHVRPCRRLFFYYFTNDGVERDVAFVTELVQTGQLDMDIQQGCHMRQLVSPSIQFNSPF